MRRIPLALVCVVAAALAAPVETARAAGPLAESAADKAVAFIDSQQQSDGGYETVGFPGTELPPPSTGGLAALEPLVHKLTNNRRLLIVGAHPDDENSSLLALVSRKLGGEAAYPGWEAFSRLAR